MKLKEGVQRHQKISSYLGNQITADEYEIDGQPPSENEQLACCCQELGNFAKDRRRPGDGKPMAFDIA